MSTTQLELDGVTRDRGQGNLERIRINTELASAEIYLHGAHITHFHPRGADHPVLWMSKSSVFKPDKAIRGGIPICFPWFGPNSDDPKAPAHGFARTRDWKVESIQPGETGAIIVVLQMKSDDSTKKWWNADFAAHYVVSVGNELSVQLTVQNLGRDTIRYEEALHSYFVIGNAQRIEVRGLEGASYLDRLQPGKTFTQDDQPIRFSAETDRTYINTDAVTTIVDPVLRRRIINRKIGSNSTVVWNPWINKAKAMADFGDDEWPGMLCIETANAGPNAVELPAGQKHSMSAVVSVESM
ncbi:MAG: D-hexose-6-phosphate mutarotase [Anaerolineae bacterium]|nr:D-hexose-6-phosphate mutarotase [Phycisphaerae bacterium]